MDIMDASDKSVDHYEHCPIPMADGISLSSRLWIPADAFNRPVPAILEYIPYRKRDMVRIRDEQNHGYFAANGYACVRADMRGSGDSEGIKTDMYDPDELDDAITVINWIAEQPWCNGYVGMFGTSWGGTASLQAASRRSSALKAIIAVCATNNRFEDDIHHMGGNLLTDTVEWGATLPAILASPPDPESAGGGWRKIWKTRLDSLEFPLENWIKHETRDEYWRRGSLNESPSDIQCPILAIGGWSDRYSNTVMNTLQQGHGNSWGIIGPWGHHYPDVGVPGPAMGFREAALRWWNHWLKGEENGVEQDPRLLVWMQEKAATENWLKERPGKWVSDSAFAFDKKDTIDFFLRHPGESYGSLIANKSEHDDTVSVPWSLQVGAAAGDTGYFGRDGGLPLDQQIDDDKSTVFESLPVEEAIEIIGRIELSLNVESDQPVSTLVCRISDVSPENSVSRVGFMTRNLCLDDALSAPIKHTPFRPRNYTLCFPNTAYRFEQGHRIRVAFSSSYWPIIWPSPTPVKLLLHLAESCLKLPLRTVTEYDEKIPEPSTGTTATRVSEKVSKPLKRHSSFDSTTGFRIDAWQQPLRLVHFHEIDLDFGNETHARHEINVHDCNSARSYFCSKLIFHRDDWKIIVTGEAELRSDENFYLPSGSVKIKENGTETYRREWAPRIPRTVS